MIKKRALLCLAGLFLSFSATSLSVEQLFGETHAAALRKNGKLQTSTKTSQSGTFELVPNTSMAHMLYDITDSLQDKYFVESVYLYTKSDKTISDPNVPVILRSLSTLKGIEYYSNTKKKYRVLYEDSYRATPDGKQLPDPQLSDDSEQPFLVYQDDSTLGGNYYWYRYYINEQENVMTSINRDSMSYLFIDVVEKEDMVAFVWTYDTGTELVFYMVVSADFCSLPDFVKNAIDRSFGARADALFAWFTKKIEQTENKENK